MTYPQTRSSQEVLERQEFYRLYTEIVSSGDVYEIDSSVRAFAIGPQSDIARARITYFDASMPGQQTSFVVSVGSPWVGQIDASPSNPILVTIEDQVTNKAGWVGASVMYERPRIDLIAYLSIPSMIATKRADYQKQGVLYLPVGGVEFFLPFYRRKYASIKITNRDVARDVSLQARGHTILPGTETDTGDVVVLASSTVPSGNDDEFTIRSTSKGMHDILSLLFSPSVTQNLGQDPDTAIYYAILFTDEEI